MEDLIDYYYDYLREKPQLEYMELKEMVFDLFDKYTDYYDIVSTLRNMTTKKTLSTRKYHIIMTNYDKWLKEYREENDK